MSNASILSKAEIAIFEKEVRCTFCIYSNLLVCSVFVWLLDDDGAHLSLGGEWNLCHDPVFSKLIFLINQVRFVQSIDEELEYSLLSLVTL